jgi:hypothetical protein
MLDLDTIHRVMRSLHIAIGGLGVILFWIPVFSKKGGRIHIFTGRLFAWCAYFVGTTGLIGSVWGLSNPASFFGDPAKNQIDPRSLPYVMEKARFLFSITGFLALAVLAGTYFGVRVVRTRRDHRQFRNWLLVSLESILGLWCIGLVAFGVYSLINCYAGRHLLPASAAGRYWIPVALGAWGSYTVYDELKYIFRPRPTPMAWWYRHMESMLGAGIAFHTAFLVFALPRIVGLDLKGAWQLLPWLLPSALGIPAIVVWVRYYERRFEGSEASNAS